MVPTRTATASGVPADADWCRAKTIKVVKPDGTEVPFTGEPLDVFENDVIDLDEGDEIISDSDEFQIIQEGA